MSKIFLAVKNLINRPKKQQFKQYSGGQLKIIAMKTRIVLQQKYNKLISKIHQSDTVLKQIALPQCPISKKYQVLQQIGNKIIQIQSIKIYMQMCRRMQAYSQAIINTKGNMSLLHKQLIWFQSILWYRRCKNINYLDQIYNFCFNFFHGVDIMMELNAHCQLFRIHPLLQYLTGDKFMPIDELLDYLKPYIDIQFTKQQIMKMHEVHKKLKTNQKNGQNNKVQPQNRQTTPIYPQNNNILPNNNQSNNNQLQNLNPYFYQNQPVKNNQFNRNNFYQKQQFSHQKQPNEGHNQIKNQNDTNNNSQDYNKINQNQQIKKHQNSQNKSIESQKNNLQNNIEQSTINLLASQEYMQNYIKKPQSLNQNQKSQNGQQIDNISANSNNQKVTFNKLFSSKTLSLKQKDSNKSQNLQNTTFKLTNSSYLYEQDEIKNSFSQNYESNKIHQNQQIKQQQMNNHNYHKDIIQSIQIIKNYFNPEQNNEQKKQQFSYLKTTQQQDLNKNEQQVNKNIKNIKKPYMVSIYARKQFMEEIAKRNIK